jgi:hypothetical protein
MVTRDLECTLNTLGMIGQAKMTQAHFERGKVERTVRSVRKLFEDFQVHRKLQSVISWETTLGHIANTLNNLPIARTSESSKAERGEIDVITKNHILVGRNNFRSPDTGDFLVDGNPMKALTKIREINEYFFTQIVKNLFEFTQQKKWLQSDKDCEVGDLVLFRFKEGEIAEVWRLGIVEEKLSKENKPGQWKVRYKLAGEKEFRTTPRSSRELSIIHEVASLDYNSLSHLWAYKSLQFQCLSLHADAIVS